MIPIYIPTRGRMNNQVTWDSIGPEAREYAALVCPQEEINWHTKQGRDCINRGEIKGINNVRQFILEHAMEAGHDKIIVLDDDLIFGRRIHGMAANLRKTTKKKCMSYGSVWNGC